MGGIRVRWRALAKLAAVVTGALAALQQLPDLLTPPAPPPLARDVGLPRVKATTAPKRRPAAREAPEEREALPRDVISSVPHRHLAPRPKPTRHGERGKPRPAPAPTPGEPPAPPPEPSPPPREPPPPVATAPPPPPSPPPPSAAEPPGDGSEEFAPH